MGELLQENGDALLQETEDEILLDILTLPFRTRISAIRIK